MFATIVIGIDGRQGGRDALALGQTLAAPGAQLTLVHVWNELEGLAAVATGAKHPAAAAHDLLDEARGTAGPECHITARRATSPGAGLHQLAEELDADLIVVGSSVRQRAGRVLLGDETRAALHGAPCAVAVASAGGAEREGIRRVGAAYEPTPSGAAALRAARELAADLGAETHAIRVVPQLPSAWLGAPLAYLELLAELPLHHAEETRDQLTALGGLTAHVAQGSPVRELIDFSAAVDVLVVGSRGYGPAARLLIGSTADGVTREAHCPVLVVPRPAPLEDDARHGRTLEPRSGIAS